MKSADCVRVGDLMRFSVSLVETLKEESCVVARVRAIEQLDDGVLILHMETAD